jgi:hypothetical protein
MLTYSFGEAAAGRVRRLRQQRDLAFIAAAERTFDGLPNELALIEQVRDGTGVQSGYVTPFACNLPLRQRAARATSAMLRALLKEHQLNLVAITSRQWIATVWEPSLPLGTICSEALDCLASSYASLVAVVRISPGERQEPFIAPWDFGADVIAICWGERDQPPCLTGSTKEMQVQRHSIGADDIAAVSATMWELSGADLPAYDWHTADVTDSALEHRLSTPIWRSYQSLAAMSLRNFAFAHNSGILGQRVLDSCK